MKLLLCFLFFGTMVLSGADIVIHKPLVHFMGNRISSRQQSVPGSGVVRSERVPEVGYRFVFAIQNTSGNIVKLATGFNHINFKNEPEKNQFVLQLSHRIMSVKPESGDAFPLVQPLEAFRIVTLRPREGTLLNITCWIPESKVRQGDKLVIEYNPCNFGRYDFMQTKVRSLPMELKLPGAVKKVDPVMI